MTTHQLSPYRLLMHNVVCATRCALRFISTTLWTYRPRCDSVCHWYWQWYLFHIWNPSLLPTSDCLWNGNYQILTGIPIFGIDSPLPKAGDLRNLWSYVFCKGVHMTTVADHLGSARFNIVAKSSLSELMYIINDKTPLEKDIMAAMFFLSLYRIIFA